MSFPNFDTVPPRTSLPSRVALALAHAKFASNTQPQVDSFESTEEPVSGHVKDLLEDPGCKELWTKLQQDPYPNSELAKGTAALNGFRHYMIQDAIYLEYFARVRMESISRTGTWEDIKEFVTEASESLKYAVGARSDCTNKLGVPEHDVAKEQQSTALIDSVNLYEDVASTGDWLDMNIVQLPCIIGYYKIADKLKKEASTVKDSPYYKLWIDPNADITYATQYSNFVNSHINGLTEAQRKARWQGWVARLNLACQHEMAFFRLGSTTPPYQIVSDREYNIRSSLKSNLYLVVDSSSVTAKTIDPKDPSAKWTLTNSSDGSGYTIKNGTKFLDSPTAPIHQGQAVTLSNEEKQYWSINPAEVQVGNSKPYQFLVPAGLQWVLDIDSASKVVVGNNSQTSSQSWLIEDVPA